MGYRWGTPASPEGFAQSVETPQLRPVRLPETTALRGIAVALSRLNLLRRPALYHREIAQLEMVQRFNNPNDLAPAA